MRLPNWILGVVLSLGAVLLAGCIAPPPPEQVVCSSDILRPGDSLTITFSGLPAVVTIPEQRVSVKEDGNITMPLIGTVPAAGKNLAQLEQDILGRYVPQYYKQLTVTVKPEMRWYSVGGEVKQPGRLQYLGETTLLRAIQSAGDFTDFANRRKVQIIRANGTTQTIDAGRARENPRKYDVLICPGDSIIVPRKIV